MKVCPECGDEAATYHLMMRECDKCINYHATIQKADPERFERYLHRNGLLVPNPNYDPHIPVREVKK